MVASKIKLRFVFIYVIFIFAFSVSAESKVSDNDIFNLLHNNIAKSTAELGRVIETCEKKRLNSVAVLLNVDLLKKLKAKNNDVIVALTYISFNNSFKCEKRARINLAYDLGLLASVKRKHDSNIKDINEIEDNLIYPSVKQIRLSIRYLKLPDKLKKYIKEAVGNKPFDLIKTMKINHLLNI